jgi:hypothetical protein
MNVKNTRSIFFSCPRVWNDSKDSTFLEMPSKIKTIPCHAVIQISYPTFDAGKRK